MRTPLDYQKILEMRESGNTYTKIATCFNTSRQRIHQVCKIAKIQREHPVRSGGSLGIACPDCGCVYSRVCPTIRGNTSAGMYKRRRRECCECKRRFTTHEVHATSAATANIIMALRSMLHDLEEKESG